MNDRSSRYLMYMHAGSANHGCEAIVRSLCDILDDGEVTLLSNNPEQDLGVGLNEACRVLPVRPHDDGFVRRAWFYLLRKLTGRADAQMRHSYAAASPLSAYDLALSIGGDNYCYADALTDLGGANLAFNKAGLATALIGCSIEPETLSDPKVVEDLSRYGLIVARESITLEALRKALPAGKGNDVRMFPDPAFALEPRQCKLPSGFKAGHTIGINVSPMIINYEAEGRSGITMDNYRELIRVMLRETGDVVALIPHVVTPLSDDRVPLTRLYEEFCDSGRVVMVTDRPAMELKYVISRCRLLIAARTHASIAAYSTGVPTLVVGYSVKACGIARDLFGTDEGYVCPVQSLRKADDLASAYTWLEANADEQREILHERIPEWKEQVRKLREIL